MATRRSLAAMFSQLIENNAKLYHKAGNKTFQGGEWERFQEKTFLICLF